jgi:tetratricopeptide (TPR) repeat protein
MPESDYGAEFSPAQLDLLEDALEDPELLPDGASPALRDRLESYRAILGLADEAMPMVDVPDGLLDSVLAEARNSPAIEPEIAASPGLWERLRRSFVLPGFALAATAVLLIVVLRPDDPDFGDMSEEAASATPAKAEASSAESPVIEARPEADVVPAAPPTDEAADGDERELIEASKTEPAAEAEPSPMPASKDAKRLRTVKSKKSAAKADAPASGGGLGDPFAEADDEEEVDADDKDALRSLLQQADSDRLRGRCGDAAAAYKKLLGTKGNEEARALMGLGLCAEAQGDDNTATDYYRRAKAINPALDSLISSERKKLTAPRDSKKSTAKKSKPKAKSKLPADAMQLD